MNIHTLTLIDDDIGLLQTLMDFAPPLATRGLAGRVNAMLAAEAEARKAAMMAAATEAAAGTDATADAQRAAMAASREGAQ